MRIHSALGIRPSALRRAFTLLELLVVIGIIALLLAILFPVVGKIREAAREADSRSEIFGIESACQAYYQDFSAYPGPLADSYLTAVDQSIATTAYSDPGIYYNNSSNSSDTSNGKVMNDLTVSTQGTLGTGAQNGRVTENENAVLGLCGGLLYDRVNDRLNYDPSTLGEGALNLNRVRPGRSKSYIQKDNLSKGKFVDENGLLNTKDTAIPEFVDRWPAPMPLLILRARKGGGASTASGNTITDKNNNVIVNVPFSPSTPEALNGQFNLVEITPYTQGTGGAGGLVAVADLATTVQANQPLLRPKENRFFDAYAYFTDPSTDNLDTGVTIPDREKKHRARKADSIVIISAGRDRVYGTADDVTNFGSVLP